ncbi:protein kinase domain-containing protein [Rubrivirga sp. IMCC45206]|uniref:serine/threonine-protein kinase n=1 Tax=Rubrivirga sp. IMCC45206 TaxID=3391614 RepID=UPI00399015F7
MPTDPLDRLERLFRAALLHPPEERAAFLDAACDDPALRREVESLLASDAEAGDHAFLGQAATGLLGDLPAAAPPADALVGGTVGPYRVLRPLGEGGMGAVYLAVREAPFLRHVALKVIRGSAPDLATLRRFEQERQILASLDHPGIARLLDGGVTDDGRPYFAMEYVEGRSITAYADAHRLGLGARLRLFRAVCEAVHYAHQNLVLHRDLKPSNILVTSDGTVKLLDFGIAKLLNPNLSAAAMPVTRTALRVMTPEYASPEQVRGEGLSTASDVYGLGVVLYELLAGRRPYRLGGGSAGEIVRAVVEADPERPSTAVARDETVVRADGSTEVVSAAAVGAARGASPDRLRRRLRGDLDAIVLKALRKEPERRFPSAEALSHDIERYQAGQPVLAHRGSRAYRLGKLVRRHRPETALAGVVLAAILGVALVSSTQARRLAAERDRAQTEATKAEEVAAFLVSVFEQADPTATRGDTLTAREMLAGGAARVERELAAQPEVQAAVLHTIAQAYRGLGRDDRARPLFERAVALRRRALGDDHPETLRALFDLGTLYETAGETDAAAAAFEQVLARRRARLGDTHPELIQPLYHLGLIRHITGQAGAADSLFAEWEALLARLPDADSPLLSQGLSDYYDLLFTQRRYDEAEPYVRRALAMDRRLHGDLSAPVGFSLNRLAELLNITDRPAEAEAAAREALAIHERLYPDGHRELGASLQSLGEAAQRRGRYAEADALFRRDLALRRQLYGDGHFSTARSHALLARLHHDRGHLDAAERDYRAAVAIFAGQFGPAFLTTIQHRQELADVLTDAGRYREAEAMLLDDLQALDDRDQGHRTVQATLRRLVRLYEAWGRPGPADRYRPLVHEDGRA